MLWFSLQGTQNAGFGHYITFSDNVNHNASKKWHLNWLKLHDIYSDTLSSHHRSIAVGDDK